MKAIAFLLLLFATECCFAAVDTNVIAIGDWSAPVGSADVGPVSGGTLRGRILLAESPKPGFPSDWHDVAVYLELQECSDSWGGTVDVYCNMIDASSVHWELRDGSGRPVPEASGGSSGGAPGRFWITMPCDSTVRLRATVYGGGRGDDGRLHIAFLPNDWLLTPGRTNDYYLSGTFTVIAPTNHVVAPEHRVWQGALTLPRMKLPVPRP